ncbi:MAG: PrsW family intramembrane metalloprotease [Chloroflexi bacterium]|nr:PrsW family intramembrane metalloprotease [Chloroflexota bacterium]MBI3170302.1 PrsW family intramembrane metalloprotease [Chloroflexota bacterium]
MNESKAIHERKHIWRDEFLLIIGLCVFVGIVYALDNALHPVFTPATLLLTGVFLALVPAFIWMIFFYMQDSAEPEPKGFVIGVFVLGGLLAAAVGIPVVENLFRVSHWVYNDTLTTILGGILVVGFTQEFLKYAAVRYSIYHSDEFDEPTDGVVYATAAGLGYATVLNIQFVVSNGGVDLGTGILRMAVVALAQAAFSGITGYFLGRAKFESEQVWWMPLGISLAAIFNGLFNWLLGIVNQPTITLSGSTSNTWMGLVLAAVVALVTTGVILMLVRRNIKSLQAGK